MNQKSQKDEKHSKEKWFILILLLLLLVSGILIGIMLLQRKNQCENIVGNGGSGENTGGGIGVIIDSNAESTLPNENGDDAEQGVVIFGWASMTIPANQKEVIANFYNPEENSNLYYLTFELRLYSDNAQDYEVLYKSGLVEPGKLINEITLSHELEQGVYDAVIHVQPYRMNEERTRTNNADMIIQLVVV